MAAALLHGIGLQRLRRGEALDVLGGVRVQVAGLISHKADHGHSDSCLVQFLQQPIPNAGAVLGRSGATKNVREHLMGQDRCEPLPLGLEN